MAMILVSDTHLGLYQSKDMWHEVVTDLFKEIVYVCQSKDINTIVFLGDFFHERKVLNIKTLAVAQEIAHILLPVKRTYLLGGNHDSFYKDRPFPTALDVFDDNEHIHLIIDHNKYIEGNIVLVPWFGDISSADAPFCFGHFEINGFPMNNSQYCSKGPMRVDQFKKFESVLSGHFHMPSMKENIRYLGSPFQQRFSDEGSSRGYYIFDNGELEFIEFVGPPKFITQHTDNELRDIEGNIVRLIYDRDYGTNKNNSILEEVEALKPQSLKPDFSKINVEEDGEEAIEDVVLLDASDIIRDYVMNVAVLPEVINKKMLIKIMENMIKEE